MQRENTRGRYNVHGSREVKDGHSTTGCRLGDQSASRRGYAAIWLVAWHRCCHDDENRALPVWSVFRHRTKGYGWIGCRTMFLPKPKCMYSTCTVKKSWATPLISFDFASKDPFFFLLKLSIFFFFYIDFFTIIGEMNTSSKSQS